MLSPVNIVIISEDQGRKVYYTARDKDYMLYMKPTLYSIVF